MARDPGALSGAQSYGPPSPLCECGDLEALHNIGTHAGVRVRTACSVSGCGCRLYRPAGAAPTAPAGPGPRTVMGARYWPTAEGLAALDRHQGATLAAEDPELRDELVDIICPHAAGCQDVECGWCDDAMRRADLILAVLDRRFGAGERDA